MAVAGVGIERDVGQDADLGHRILDRLDRAADQIVGVERFARVVGAQLLGRVREQRDARNAKLGRLLCLGADAVELQRLTPGSEPIGSSQSRPSQTNSGQMKSLGCSRFSASIARIHGLDAAAAHAKAGKEADMAAPLACPRPRPTPQAASARPSPKERTCRTSSSSAAAVTSGPAPGPWMTRGCDA